MGQVMGLAASPGVRSILEVGREYFPSARAQTPLRASLSSSPRGRSYLGLGRNFGPRFPAQPVHCNHGSDNNTQNQQHPWPILHGVTQHAHEMAPVEIGNQ